MLKKIFLNIRYLIFIISCISFCACWFPPKYSVVFGLLSWGVPIIMIYHFIILMVSFFKKTKNYLAAIVIILGIPHYYHTYSYSFLKDDQKYTVNVLNYNVQSFNCYDHLRDEDYGASKKMINFIGQDSLDIVCIQEYYNLDSSSIFNVECQMNKKGFKNHLISVALIDKISSQFGMAIFSKYPIINKREIIFNPKTANRILIVDIKLPTNDIIRLFSCHLQSINLSVTRHLNWELAKKQKFRGQEILFKRVCDSFEKRNKQVDTLLFEIEKSPYPVLVCGDFNDLPYSYTYHQLLQKLNNSFDEQGNGFGFSLNHPYLKFLRIDNQFFDAEKLEISSFKTCYDIPYSDHFPLYGTYVVKKDNH